MTQREKFEKWLNTLDKQTLVIIVARQAKTIKLMQAYKATSFSLPDRMDYELHGDKVINDPFADGYNQCLSDVIAANEEYANSAVQDGWIPVSERLPAYGDDCLIVAEGKSEPENIVYEFTKDKFSSEDQFVSIPGGEDYFYARNVSHWMPLPSAPERNK